MLVDQIKSVGLGVIAEEELFLVCVGQLHNLLSNQVENTSLDVGEDKAILADPETGGNDVREFLHKVESLLTAIIIVVWVGIRITRRDVLAHCLSVVIEEVILILKSKDDLLTVLRPVDIAWGRADVDAPNHSLSVPVVKSNEFLRLCR